jgi:hypothetical protein
MFSVCVCGGGGQLVCRSNQPQMYLNWFFWRIRVPRVTRVFEKKESSIRVFQNRVIWNH